MSADGVTGDVPVTTPRPRVEILTVRDPDSANAVWVFVDGQECDWYESEDVDPGAGHMRSEWLGRKAQVIADEDYSPEFKKAVLTAIDENEDSSYVEDDEGIDLSCWALIAGPTNFCTWRYEDDGDDVDAAAAALIAHRKAAHPKQ